MPSPDQITTIAQLKSQGKSLVEIAAAVGLEMGDVESVVDMAEVLLATGNGVSQILAGDGVSVSPSNGEGVVTVGATGGGGPFLVQFAFAFDTPGLLDGVVIHTTGASPEALLDAWMTVSAAFDGDFPTGDFYTDAYMTAREEGFFFTLQNGVGAIDMTAVSDTEGGVVFAGNRTLNGNGIGEVAEIPADTALKVCVSGNGTPPPFGSDAGSTQGAAIINVLLCPLPT